MEQFVCISDKLTLICNTNGTSIQWGISNPHNLITGVGNQLISTTTTNERLENLKFATNRGIFQFFRTSSSPLISELQIDNVTADLNGTRVECTSIEGMTTTVINIIDTGNQELI